VHKHNGRYLQTVHLVRAAFAEKKLGQVVASILHHGNYDHPPPEEGTPIFSKMHNYEINCFDFFKFARKHLLNGPSSWEHWLL
jgi:hypothetical protein